MNIFRSSIPWPLILAGTIMVACLLSLALGEDRGFEFWPDHWPADRIEMRIDAITVELAAMLSRGAIDELTYIHLFEIRTRAHRAVIRWIHGSGTLGARREAEARQAWLHLEAALP